MADSNCVRFHRVASLSLLFILSIFTAACGSDAERLEVPGDDPPLATVAQPIWVNGGFENDAIGTTPPSGWTLTTNLNSTGLTDTRPNPQTLASLNLTAGGILMTAVVGGPTETMVDPDLLLLGTMRYPKYGVRAARVNATGAATGLNRNVNTLKQTMTTSLGDVDATDNKVHVRFALTAILENPAHTYISQPYYFVRVQNLTKAITIYQDFNTSGQTGVPWKNFIDTTGNPAQYTDWMLVDVAPGDAQLAVGDQVELTIVAAGCSLGGHWGRVYVDGVGSGVPGLFTFATGPQSVNAGSSITYTVNYKNGGATSTANTKVDLVTPPSTTFQAVSLGGACTTPAVGATGTVSCSLGTLAPGATGSFTVTVNVPAATANGTLITNGNYSIYATGSNALLGPKVNTTVTAAIAYANVGVTFTDGIAAIGWGQPTTYQLTVTNQGPVNAPAVTVTNNVPAQLTNVTWTCAGTGGGTCAASGSGAISNLASLPVGATVRYTIAATVVAGSGNGQVVNTATATVGGSVVDPDTSNNTAVDTNAIGNLRTITLDKLGTIAAGSVSSTPSAFTCGTSCSSASGQLLEGSQVVLTASPVAGAVFSGWGGACSGTAPTCTLTMSADRTVTASFTGPTVSIFSGNNQLVDTNGQFLLPLTVQFLDANGVPVVGAVVTFAPPGSGASAVLSSLTATTNFLGLASVTATANAIGGTYSVTASIPGATPASFTLTNIGDPASLTIVSGTPQSAVVGTAFAAPLVVRLRDLANQPVGGVTITFTVPATGPRATLSAATAVTDASGQAQLTATAGTIPGTYNVTASQGLFSVNFALTNTVGAPANLTLIAPTTRSAPVNSALGTFTVEVTDAFGNLVPGALVTFAAPAAGASASLSATTATTGPDGRASTTAAANAVAGTYALTASVVGAAPQSFTVTNTPAAPAQLTIVSGTPQTTIVGTAFAPLVVQVRDNFNNPVPGTVVTFAAPSTGASATVTTTVTTDASGQAATTATATNLAGSYAVTATADGLSVSFALTNTPADAASITVVSGSGQSAEVTTDFAAALVVRVADAFGNVLSGATITFAAPATGASASLSATTATTDASGLASIIATANPLTGSYAVTAAAPGVAAPATFALTNTAGAPATLTLIAPTTRSAEVGTSLGTFTVEVTDAQGNLVPGATVTFAAPAPGASAILSSTTATTGADGRAATTATANTIAGSYDLTVSAAGAPAQSFAITNTAGAAATLTLVSGDAQSATGGSAFAPLVVRVRDRFGNDVSGVTVTFTAPASGATATVTASAVSDNDGLASATATAGTIAGTYSVTAAATGATSVAFSLTNTAGAPATVSVVSGSNQSTAVTTAFAAALIVRVADANDNPVAGATVTFTRPATGATAALSATTVTTAANGQAQVTATANNVAGSYPVTAAVAGVAPTATFDLTNTPGPAALFTLIAPTTRTATVATSLGTFVAEVTDVHRNPIPGATVTFAAPAAGASATLSAPSATTGADGRAAITATANTTAGSYTLTVTTTGLPAQTFAITNTAGAPATVAVVSGGPQSTAVTTAFPAALVVRVSDSFGNPSAGTTITFTAPASGATATLSATTAATAADGQAQITATAGPIAGSYDVTAAVAAVATPATFDLTNTPGPAANLVLIAPTTRAATVGTSLGSFIAEVTDAQGNVIPGVTVSFAAPNTGATATLSATSAVTGANGRATITATANNLAGSYAIIAAVAGLPAQSFTITNTPAAPATLTLISGSGQSAVVGTPFPIALVVRVADSFGNVIPGATVAFAAPATGASASVPATVTTDAAGLATAAATAGTVTGSYAVTASTAGVATPVTFALTNTPGAAFAVEVVSGGTQSAEVTDAFAAPLAIRVVDAFGNPVPGATVTFASPATGASAQLSATTVTTGANGQAQLTAAANTVAGAYAITASTAGVATPASFALTNTAGPPVELALLGGSDQSAEIETAFAAPLRVVIRDAFGNGVPDAAVTFTAPATGATATVAPTVTTGADGIAVTAATAGSIAGSYAVIAAVNGVATPVTFALTNSPAAATVLQLVSGDAQETAVDTFFAQPLVVRVRDRAGNPVPGTIVRFTAPGTTPSANLSANSATTDAAGLAQIFAEADTRSGSYAVTAEVSPTVTVSFALRNLPGAPAQINVAPTSSPQSATVLQEFIEPLAVQVVDRFGNPTPGATVTFAVPAAGASAQLSAITVVADAQGRASVIATANASAGAYLATAAVAGIPDAAPIHLSNLAGAASFISVESGDRQATAVDTNFAAPLTVLVVDAQGNPVPGAVVSFAAAPGAITAVLSASAVATGADGKASVTARASTATGPHWATAVVGNASAPAVFALTNTAGPAFAITAELGDTPQAAEVGTPYPRSLTVQVVDRFGNPVPGAVITYAAPATGASGALSSTAATTDASGQAAVFVTANSTAGAFDVVASVPGASPPARFQLTNLAGPAHQLSLVSGDEQSAEVTTTFAGQLIVRVTDDFGNPVVGELVTFAPGATPGSSASATLAPLTVASDAQGRAATTATATTATGSYDVIATSAQGALPVLFELTNTPGAPATAVAISGATPQNAEARNPFDAPLGVLVLDRFGNRVPGVVVTYSSPANPGATLSSPTSTTDLDGISRVLAIADATAGTYQVSATVPGIAAPVIFLLTNTPTAGRYLVIDRGAGQSTTATTSFAQPLVFRVVDNFGNPVAGVVLSTAMTQTGPGAAMTTSSNVTDANGEVRYHLVANSVLGMFAVTATADGTSGLATAVLEITAIPTQTTLTMPEDLSVSADATATIRVTADLGTPAGTVELLDEVGAVVATAELTSGSAEAEVAMTALGQRQLTARYLARGPHAASTSAPVTFDVGEDTGSLNGTISCSAGGAGASSGGGAGGALPVLLALGLVIAWRRRRDGSAVRDGAAVRATRAAHAARAPSPSHSRAAGGGNAARFAAPLALALVALALAAAPAAAQVDVSSRSVNRFHAASAESSWFSADSLEFHGHLAATVSLTGDYAMHPFAVYNFDEQTRTIVIESSLLAHVTASVAIRDFLRLSASAPLAIYQDGDDGMYNGSRLPSPDFAFGDMYLAGDVRVLGGARSTFRAAVGVRFTVPTGMRNDYMSDSELAVEPRALVAASRGRLELAASAGAFLRPETELATESFGSELRYTASLGIHLLRDHRLLIGPELIGALALTGDDTGNPTEVGGGAHYRVNRNVRLGLGATVGVVNAVGVPDARFFLNLSWRP